MIIPIFRFAILSLSAFHLAGCQMTASTQGKLEVPGYTKGVCVGGCTYGFFQPGTSSPNAFARLPRRIHPELFDWATRSSIRNVMNRTGAVPESFFRVAVIGAKNLSDPQQIGQIAVYCGKAWDEDKDLKIKFSASSDLNGFWRPKFLNQKFQLPIANASLKGYANEKADTSSVRFVYTTPESLVCVTMWSELDAYTAANRMPAFSQALVRALNGQK